MNKLFSYLIMGSVLLSLIASCAPATPAPTAASPTLVPTEPPSQTATQQPIHLSVGVYNYISNAPLFIARDEGYFIEQGLDVELIDFGSASDEIIPALVARKLDAAMPSFSVAIFNAVLQGNNLKYVADKGFMNPTNCVTDGWVASKPVLASGAASTATLKDKNFVFPPGGTLEYAFDVLLAKNGLTQKDVKLTNIADSTARIEGLKNGSVDVSVLSEPWITRAQAAGAGDIWVPLSQIIPGMSLGTVVFGPGILEDKPDAGVRFITAYLKAVKQFNEGKTDRNVAIIAGYTKLKPEDVKTSCWTSFKPDGSMDTESMLAFQTWAKEKGYVDGTLELDKFYTSEFITAAAKNLSK
jgi:NitT/TauT family transport system substrate-binding protein